MPAAPGTRSSAFLRSQSSRAASMSSPTCRERRSMSSTSRSGSSMPRGLPVALRLLTLLELLAQVGVLVGAALVRVLTGFVGQAALLALARGLIVTHLVRLALVHRLHLREDRFDHGPLLVLAEVWKTRDRETAGVVALRLGAQPHVVAIGVAVPRMPVDRHVVDLHEDLARVQRVVERPPGGSAAAAVDHEQVVRV